MDVIFKKFSRKKQSPIEKLWKKIERQQEKNNQLSQTIERLMERYQSEIVPAERDGALAGKKLLERLLELGQRKSLANWERDELYEWIMNLMQQVSAHGVDDATLMDNIARYNAFHMGISLDKDAPESASIQLANILNDEQKRREQQEKEVKLEMEEELRNTLANIDKIVEKMLIEKLGPPPSQIGKRAEDVQDMWQEELDAELAKKREEYDSACEYYGPRLKGEFLARLRRDIKSDGFDADEIYLEFGIDKDWVDGFDDFDEFEEEDDENDWDDEEFWGDEDDWDDEDEDDSDPYGRKPDGRQSRTRPKVTNQLLQKLFRATAARLHPDRETDDKRRDEKQVLMGQLLKARKTSDILSIIQMHQEHVGEIAGLSDIDEDALMEALQSQYEILRDEYDDIPMQSEATCYVYDLFYRTSKKKTDQAFADHLEQVKESARESERLADEVRTLKALRPLLRRDSTEDELLDEFMKFFDEQIRRY